jgi:hypothetical protein
MARIRAAHRARPGTYRPPATTLWRPCGGPRRRTSAVIWSALFTVVQAWALIVVLALVPAQGVAHVALTCSMAGAVTAVIMAWEKCTLDRDNGHGQCVDQMDQYDPQQHDTVPLRGHTER